MSEKDRGLFTENGGSGEIQQKRESSDCSPMKICYNVSVTEKQEAL